MSVDQKQKRSLKPEVYASLSWGIFLVVTTTISSCIGLFLDRKFGSSPWLMIVFFMLGAVAGFWQIKKELARMMR